MPRAKKSCERFWKVLAARASRPQYREKIAIAHRRQNLLLLRDRLTGHYVARLRVQRDQLAPLSLLKRKVLDECGGRASVESARRNVVIDHGRGSPSRACRSRTPPLRTASRATSRGAGYSVRSKAWLNFSTFTPSSRSSPMACRAPEGLGRLNGFAAAVAQDQPPIDSHLAAARVAAEVVVVIQNQNARVGIALTIEVGGREPADPCTHDHQVDCFINGQAFDRELMSIAKLVRTHERRVGTAAHAVKSGRIRGGGLRTQQLERSEARADRQCNAVEKVPPCDLLAHAQLLPAQAIITAHFTVRRRWTGRWVLRPCEHAPMPPQKSALPELENQRLAADPRCADRDLMAPQARQPSWIDLGSVEELRDPPLREIKAGTLRIALSYRDGKFGAVSGICNHVGGPARCGHARWRVRRLPVAPLQVPPRERRWRAGVRG